MRSTLTLPASLQGYRLCHGLEASGVRATLKHFPGLGRVTSIACFTPQRNLLSSVLENECPGHWTLRLSRLAYYGILPKRPTLPMLDFKLNFGRFASDPTHTEKLI